MNNNNKTFKFLSWNVRGLNQKEKRTEIKHEIITQKPQLVCLQETKWDQEDERVIRQTVGNRLDKFILVNARDTAGGILLAWDSNFFTEIEHSTHDYMISVDLAVNIDNSVFRYTGVYGPSNQSDKMAFLNIVAAHKPELDYPWIIGGDFNVTLHTQERSNQAYPQYHMNKFRDLLQRLHLNDLRLQGRKYTWSRGREEATYARLDRFLVSTTWADLFPNTTQTAITNLASDHCPIICTCQSKFPTTNIFRMENVWLKNQQFKELVQSNWTASPTAQTPKQFCDKLMDLRKKIIQWKKDYNK